MREAYPRGFAEASGRVLAGLGSGAPDPGLK